MSLEIKPTMICDGCGVRVDADVEKRFTHAAECAWRLRHKLERAGWMTLSRGRYYPAAHYCPECKDKPIKPIKSGPRKKKPKRPPTIIIGGHVDPTLPGDSWKDHLTDGDEWRDENAK